MVGSVLVFFGVSPLLSASFPSLLPLSSEIIRVGDNKKVHHIDLMLQEQLLAVISGRNRHVRLFPSQALDGRETEFYKLAETKGCQTIVSGPVRNGSITCLCVAMKNKIICYEVRKSSLSLICEASATAHLM